ncbi:hypothetical protein F2P56_031506 [Juglans regia]|uniref:Uncharacterized protein LOC109001498 n=2 Tax=Juglans regia TaxID=51240 RepID=A0A2I4FRS3_JUGRE|nr:uncharacterized protein LOC109001498 [Juglans regia]KAF5445819.1 hypothetical protein F2P56_031506 [Juglans regia]
MGSDSNPSKRHYDITMSKRTRRPSKLQDVNQDCSIIDSPRNDTSTPWKAVVNEGGESSPSRPDEAGEDDRKKSLKQLINSRNSLGQHFTQEKQLQLVTKQQDEGFQGLKLKRMVSRYAKVLSHLIKVKRDLPKGESRKKPLILLKR